ncbi:MAG: hypothetical protein ACTH31_07435, partial [Pseudoclavibacter sp.]
ESRDEAREADARDDADAEAGGAPDGEAGSHGFVDIADVPRVVTAPIAAATAVAPIPGLLPVASDDVAIDDDARDDLGVDAGAIAGRSDDVVDSGGDVGDSDQANIGVGGLATGEDAIDVTGVAVASVDADEGVDLDALGGVEVGAEAVRPAARHGATRAIMPAGLAHARRRRVAWLSSAAGVAALALAGSAWIMTLPPVDGMNEQPAIGITVPAEQPTTGVPQPVSATSGTGQSGAPPADGATGGDPADPGDQGSGEEAPVEPDPGAVPADQGGDQDAGANDDEPWSGGPADETGEADPSGGAEVGPGASGEPGPTPSGTPTITEPAVTGEPDPTTEPPECEIGELVPSLPIGGITECPEP